MIDKNQKVEAWMFRRANEYWSLAIGIVIILAIAAFFSYLNIYIFLIALFVGLVYVKATQDQYMGNALRVHSNQLPELFDTFKNFCINLGINKSALYVIQDPMPNAFTIGITTPSVILTSSLMDQLSKEELEFVLAHELGHIKAGHNVILSIVSPIGKYNAISGLIFGFWQRAAEYSADRCGLILTKRVDSAVTSLLKISVGANLFSRLNLEGFAAQMETADNSSVKFSELFVEHPLTTNRIRQILLYWKESFKIAK